MSGVQHGKTHGQSAEWNKTQQQFPQLCLYLEAFLCMVMVNKKHSCIVDQHVQRKVQLMVFVCKGLDGPASSTPLYDYCFYLELATAVG